jgi:hypothetical protein
MTHNLWCDCAQCEKQWAEQEKFDHEGAVETYELEQEKELDQLYEKDGW